MNNISRLEVNIRRLLTRCELITKDDPGENWKLEKYIQTLDHMIKSLDNSVNKPSKEILTGYIKRVEFLKGIIHSSKLTNPIEKIVAVQMLSKSSIPDDNFKLNITTQIHQKTSAKYNSELRAELFDSKKGSGGDILRQRNVGPMQDEDLDAIWKYNRNLQEKIAENMLAMTSNMKEHALAANAIIKKDINSLDQSNKLSDINSIKLKQESLKLSDHTKSNWRCWLWIMIAFVFVVFFNMVLFMKVTRKKT